MCVIYGNDDVDTSCRKSHFEPLLRSLHSILSSSRPNDAISEELAEMLGFDELELLVEILDARGSITNEVCALASLLWCHLMLTILQLSEYLATPGNQSRPWQSIDSSSRAPQDNGKPYELITVAQTSSNLDRVDLDVEAARLRMEHTLRTNANRPLYTGIAVSYEVLSGISVLIELASKMLLKYYLTSTRPHLRYKATYSLTLEASSCYPSEQLE